MGLIPDYENDIFISYAHKDNSMHSDDNRNWITLLEDYLRQRARGRGHELAIFRDVQLRPFTGFDEQLARSIVGSALLLCVISPNYAKSEWCLWELERMLQGKGLDRIIRLGKYPLDESELTDRQLKQIRQTDALIETRFYTINESTKLVEDLQPEIFPEHRPEFTNASTLWLITSSCA